MIAYLKGQILEKGGGFLILENRGIGYKIFVTPEILEMKIGQEAALYVYHKISEDSQALFGLPDFAALQFFELLVTVSGVGPKMALAILSSARADAVREAIARQDASVFTRISGIGTRTAERIIVELKDKVGVLGQSYSATAGNEVFEALVALGYSQKEIREALKKTDNSLPESQLLKEALKFLGQ